MVWYCTYHIINHIYNQDSLIHFMLHMHHCVYDYFLCTNHNAYDITDQCDDRKIISFSLIAYYLLNCNLVPATINLRAFDKYGNNIAHCFEEQAMCILAIHIVAINFIFICIWLFFMFFWQL